MISPIELTGNPTVQDVLSAVNGVIAQINNHGITADNLATNAVTNSALAPDSVDGNIIQEASITTAHIMELIANVIKGGTLTLGGEVNSSTYDGLITMEDTSGNVYGTLDKNGLSYFDIYGNSFRIATTTDNMTLTVGSGQQFETVQSAIDSLPKTLNHYILIEVYAGTYPEIVQVNGFNGNGTLAIIGGNGGITYLNSIQIGGCSAKIDVDNFTMNGSVSMPDLWAARSTDVTFYNMICAVESTHTGIETSASCVCIEDCTISNKSIGVDVNYGSCCTFVNVSGTGNTVGVSIEYGIAMGNINVLGSRIMTQGFVVAENGAMPSGNSGSYITGAPGTSGNLITWDTSGNAVDSGKKAADFAPASGSANYAPATGSANYAPSANIAESAIATASETGNATKLVTGTAGTSGNLASWDASGNAVDSGKKAADFAPASGSANYAPISGSANYAPASGSANYAPAANIPESAIASASETGNGTMIVTGTAGASGNLASWDANGNAVDSGVHVPAMVAWTPSYYNLTVGNGTVVARCCKIGTLAFMDFTLTFGSTTTIASGCYFGLPWAAARLSRLYGDLIDSSASAHYEGRFAVNTNGACYIGVVNTDGTYVTTTSSATAAIPFTWAVGDTINVTGWYETV